MNYLFSILIKSALVLLCWLIGLFFSEDKMKRVWSIIVVSTIVILSMIILDYYESKSAREPLKPFIKVAQEKYPSIPEKEALDLVLADIINPEKIKHIGKFIDSDSLIHVRHRFRSSNPCGASNIAIIFEIDIDCISFQRLIGRAVSENNGELIQENNGELIYRNSFLPGGNIIEIEFVAEDTVQVEIKGIRP